MTLMWFVESMFLMTVLNYRCIYISKGASGAWVFRDEI